MQHRWAHYPGAKVEVKNFEQGTSVIAPVEVCLFGDNLDTLRNLSTRVEKLLVATPGTMYVNYPVFYLSFRWGSWYGYCFMGNRQFVIIFSRYRFNNTGGY